MIGTWQRAMLPFFKSLLFTSSVLLSLTFAFNVNVAPRAMVKTFTPVTVQGVPEGSILIYTLYDFNGIPIGGTSGQAGATAYIYIPPYSTGSATVEATDGISTASNVLTIYNSDDVSSPETNYKTHLHPDEEAGQVAALQAGSRVVRR